MLEMSRKNFEFSVHQANETTSEVVARHWASQGYYINVGTCRFHFFYIYWKYSEDRLTDCQPNF